jgi:hypothetical protein
VFAAWRSAERILRRLGQPDRAVVYGANAEALRARFDALFFDAELGSYVLALDGERDPAAFAHPMQAKRFSPASRCWNGRVRWRRS